MSLCKDGEERENRVRIFLLVTVARNGASTPAPNYCTGYLDMSARRLWAKLPSTSAWLAALNPGRSSRGEAEVNFCICLLYLSLQERTD